MSSRESFYSGFTKSYPKRTTIFKENDAGTDMYIVLQGSVSIYIDVGGKPVKVAEVGQGGFFGEMSLLEGLRRTATAVTNSDSILVVINKENFERVIAANPSIAMRIMQGLSSRLRKLDQQLKETGNSPAPPESRPAPQEPAKAAETGEKADPKAAEAGFGAGTETTGTTDGGAPDADEASDGSDSETGESGPGYRLRRPVYGYIEDDSAAGSKDPFDLSAGPAAWGQYLYVRDEVCPVCGQKFKNLAVRYSKLKQKGRTSELRVFYQDFEPMIYEVWVCHNCYYARSYKEFSQIKEPEKQKIIEGHNERKAKFLLIPAEMHSVDYALGAHNLAAYCLDAAEMGGVQDKVAGYWLRMAWFYDDLDQKAKAKEARENALMKYKAADSVGTGSEENDHKVEYLIGALEAGMGNFQEAREQLFKAVRRRGGHKVIRDMARDALEEIKRAEKNS